MVITDFFEQRDDGVNLFRTYSDKNFKIRQIETGFIYDEAVDIESASFTYEETAEKIGEETSEEEEHEQ